MWYVLKCWESLNNSRRVKLVEILNFFLFQRIKRRHRIWRKIKNSQTIKDQNPFTKSQTRTNENLMVENSFQLDNKFGFACRWWNHRFCWCYSTLHVSLHYCSKGTQIWLCWRLCGLISAILSPIELKFWQVGPEVHTQLF